MESKVLIIEEKRNSTTDFYILSFLKFLGLEYTILRFTDLANFNEYAEIVFIVRYINRDIIKYVEKVKPKKVFYLMDDDILDIKSLNSLPYSYALKIFMKAFYYRNWIKDNTVVLVPHQTLKDKYKNYNTYILPPYPVWIDKVTFKASKNPFLIFYHATASHYGEYIWLSNLIKNIKNKNIYFEVIVGKSFDKFFKKLDNTWIVRQMEWETYKNFLQLPYRTLSLAINLPNQFNLMRSYTKFFNNIYAGVSGIYCKNFPIANLIDEYNAGFVLTLDQGNWIKTFEYIYENQDIMQQHYKNSIKLLYHLKEYAESCYHIIANNM